MSQPADRTRNIILGVVGAVGALGVGLGLAYYFFKQEPLAPEVEELIALIRQTIHQNGGHLNKNSIVLFQELIGELSQDEYSQIMISGRAKRRQPDVTDAEYEEIVKATSKGIAKLIDENENKALDLVGVPQNVYQTVMKRLAKEDPRLDLVIVRILEALRMNLPKRPDTPKMTVELARDILRFQVVKWPQLKMEIKDPEYESIVKQAKLADITVKEFKTEEEDLTSDPLAKLDEECVQLSTSLQDMIYKSDPRNQYETNEELIF